jgi:hypothetical protein
MLSLKGALPEAERQLAIAMLPRDSADSHSAMLEIRAGTGATKPRCSPPTSSACTNAMPPNRAGGSR